MIYISTSRLKTFLECPRKAVLEAKGLRRPETRAQSRGTEVHAALEAYLLGETDVVEDPLGDLARTQGLLPDPETEELLVEYGVGMPNADATRYEETDRWTHKQLMLAGLPYRGIVDLVIVRDDRIEVWDHKTTASFRWAETPRSLLGNLQVWAYTHAVCDWMGWEGDVRCGHIQYQKDTSYNRRAVRAVAFDSYAQEALIRWRIIEDLADQFAAMYRADSLARVEPDRSMCGEYGGCHLRGVCGPTPPSPDQLDASARKAWDQLAMITSAQYDEEMLHEFV